MTLLTFHILIACCSLLLTCAMGAAGAGSDSAPAANASPQAQTPTLTPDSETRELLVYIGTYTGGKSKGIYLFRLDPASGKLTAAGLAAETVNPSFLAVDPERRFLYAVNEIDNFAGTNTGAVSAFSLDPQTGLLKPLNQQSSCGAGPCHLSVDKRGKDVLVANYGSGSVAVLPIHSDGSLGKATACIQHKGSSVDPQRQEGPHAHSIQLDAANRYAFAADLGLDKILIYHFDSGKGTLTPDAVPFAEVAPGSGPRHFAFHPNGRTAYVINELNSTITAFEYDAKTGRLKTLQTVSTLPGSFKGTNHPAEIQVSPNGKFLYGSNRGDDSIVIYQIDPESGLLAYIGHQSTQGKNPRNFSIDPSGTWLLAANQDSDSVVVYHIDPQTGQLTPTGQIVDVPKPVCVTMVRMGE